MGLEREVKLFAPSLEALDTVLADPVLLAMTLAGEECQDHSFIATYVDSPALDLLQNRLALRFRRGPREWTMGLKGNGGVHNGVSLREEIEESFAATTLPDSLEALPTGEIATRLLKLLPPETRLLPLLTTRVQRRVRRLHPLPGMVCELAADWGQVEAGGKTLPLCEVELESLAGPWEPILDLARDLMQRHPLTPATHSKFTLGLSLLGLHKSGHGEP